MRDPLPAIPVARPCLEEAEAEAARRVILSGWVTQGPEVAAFEREFAEYVGAPHACAVSSCTTALHLALRAAGVTSGGEVITVSHSFIATANSIWQCGARPVFVDIQRDTFNLDPACLQAALTPRTQAVLCVHQIGLPCDLAAILSFAQPRGLPVVEDAACAIGSEVLQENRWERIGRPHADAACFSFHPRKVITTGDGGMLTTRRADWDQKFRLWRQHSMSVPDTIRHNSREVVVETYKEPGFNYRMTDIQAAVGREQLKRLPALLAHRRALAKRYGKLLEAVLGVRPQVEPVWARTNWQSYCIWLPPGTDQRRVMQAMLDSGISTRRGVMSAHREPAYAAVAAGLSLPVSEEATSQALILPLYPQMTEADQDRVVAALRQALATGGAT